MKFKQNSVILSAMLIAVLILLTGCFGAPPIVVANVPSDGIITIAYGAAATNAATPPLTISATEDATHMAFSGNGTTWSSWVAYATSYTLFNITTGPGSTSGEGTKTVYVKFKNDAGESVAYQDTIEYDITKPKLTSAAFSDVKAIGLVDSGDTIVFTFDDEMDTSTITSSNVSSRLPLSASSYGTTGLKVNWNVAGTVYTVTLGTSPDIPYGTTVYPSSSVTDVAGNAADPSAVTIGGLLNVLASVSITPSTASTTPGGATVNLTAKALNTAGGDITSLSNFTWAISSIGTISPNAGSSTVYTPPGAGTGIDTITVTAVYAGVTKTATATITVVAVVPPTPLVDPDKLFVSRRNQNAKYISLPAGATVRVYSDTLNNATAAQAGGVKVTINSDDTWTGASIAISGNHYIFFTMTDSDGWTSPITSDGKIPTAPNPIARGNIQATSENTVTSSVAGNVAGNDEITLYVGGIAYSAATPVGSTMTVTPDLVAGDVPRYTRTNPDGHESVISGTDGKILILTTAVDAQAGGGVASTLDIGDKLTLGFGGFSVDVNVPITVSNIDWVADATTAALDDGAGTLAPTGTGLANVVLIATSTYTDFASGETVDFNILPTTPIVDTAGGNQVLPAATATTFTDGTHF